MYILLDVTDTEYGLLRGRRGRLIRRKTHGKNDINPISYSIATKHELSHQFSPFSKRKLISINHSIDSSGQNRLGGIPRVGLVDLRTGTCSGVLKSSSAVNRLSSSSCHSREGRILRIRRAL